MRILAATNGPLHAASMDEFKRTRSETDRSDDCGPVAGWENEGGASHERDLVPTPGSASRRDANGHANAAE